MAVAGAASKRGGVTATGSAIAAVELRAFGLARAELQQRSTCHPEPAWAGDKQMRRRRGELCVRQSGRIADCEVLALLASLA